MTAHNVKDIFRWWEAVTSNFPNAELSIEINTLDSSVNFLALVDNYVEGEATVTPSGMVEATIQDEDMDFTEEEG